MDAEVFNAFVHWLDGGVKADGGSYVAMHARLTAYFARKGCRNAEELADETLSRVQRRLHEEGSISDVPPAQYCYIVARFVFLEHLRKPERVALSRDVADRRTAETKENEERLLASLDECLAALDQKDRDLILDYYSGAVADRIAIRKQLAARLGLSANAVGVRACRLRERLRTEMARHLLSHD